MQQDQLWPRRRPPTGPVCLELFATDANALFTTAKDGPADPGTS
ncbi:hypothetical protein OG226_07995 [Streptomyces sp. NBC_01261]|nr:MULTISPECIES: hypothetical protein [unclassified Streptomyces]